MEYCLFVYVEDFLLSSALSLQNDQHINSPSKVIV